MTILTPHFRLEELTNSSTAQRLLIDNTPPDNVLANLQILAEGLEKVRALLPIQNSPLHIDSGYRCPDLNKAVHGAADSAHMTGYAADFTCSIVGTPEYIVSLIQNSDIKFDQLIQEGTWVHISFDPRMRQEILTAHFTPEGTTYSVGN